MLLSPLILLLCRALAELLGQAKPPTVSSADIAASGLEIIKGSQVMTFCEESKILSNSADRCMVCLGDYADDEDCRLLECSQSFRSTSATRCCLVELYPLPSSLPPQNMSSTKNASTSGSTLVETPALPAERRFVCVSSRSSSLFLVANPCSHPFFRFPCPQGVKSADSEPAAAEASSSAPVA